MNKTPTDKASVMMYLGDKPVWVYLKERHGDIFIHVRTTDNTLVAEHIVAQP